MHDSCMRSRPTLHATGSPRRQRTPQTGHVGRLRGIPPSVVVRSRHERATAQTAIIADSLGLVRGRRVTPSRVARISIVAPARLPSSPPTTTPPHSTDPPDQRTDEHRPRPHRRLGILANGLAGDPPRERRDAGARPKEERCSHEQPNRRRWARQLDLGLPGPMEEKAGGAGGTRFVFPHRNGRLGPRDAESADAIER